MKLLARFLGMGTIPLLLLLLAICAQNASALPNCGTVSNLSIPAGPAGCDAPFGLTREFDKGVQPSVALLPTNLVVEFHKSQHNSGIWYHVGKLDGMTVKWGSSWHSGFDGAWPTVAVTKEGIVLLVYSDKQTRSGAQLYYRVGKIDPNGEENQSISWLTDAIHWDGGFHTSVGMNEKGVILGVHEGNGGAGKLYYRIGHFVDPNKANYTISWNSGTGGINYTGGVNPHITINNSGQIVEVHQVQNNESLLHYIRGTLSADGSRINFAVDQPRYNSNGQQGAIALTDNGIAIEVHKRSILKGDRSWTRYSEMVGKLSLTNPGLIDWSESRITDNQVLDGAYPAVATNGGWAIETGEDWGGDLDFVTSQLQDRSNWMGDMFPEIGYKTLRDIVLPGSHDAGMYCGESADYLSGKTQDQNLYQQLQGGVRYFDLRVKDGDPQLIVHANSDGTLYATCQPVETVMKDVRKFLEENHNEVVVLKFSHFFRFGNCTATNEYRRLRATIDSQIGPWMYRAGTHPAQVPLNQISTGSSKVVVVVDGDWAAPKCGQVEEGFYIYKDWCAGAGGCDSPGPAQDGEFTVYDRYSNTTDYNKMSNDQLNKYAKFDGRMEKDPNVQCDLFLLSWTLTPWFNVEGASAPANQKLGEAMNGVARNPYDLIPNVVYVDFYENSRVADTTLLMNRRFNQ